MSARTLPLVLLLIASCLVIALSFANGTATQLSIFTTALRVPTGILIAGSYILGVIVTLPILLLRAASDQSSKHRLTEWQKQDEKLAVQVQSDREKQLEAKIATLEAALQKVLKK